MQRRGLISNVGFTAILNQYFQSTLLGEGGGHKKEYAVYARENDDNYGLSLTFLSIICDSLSFTEKLSGCYHYYKLAGYPLRGNHQCV